MLDTDTCPRGSVAKRLTAVARELAGFIWAVGQRFDQGGGRGLIQVMRTLDSETEQAKT